MKAFDNFLDSFFHLENCMTGERLPQVFTGKKDHLDLWWFDNKHLFKLNEDWSCGVEISENIITIRGDEDLQEWELIPLDIIDLDK